MIALLAAAAFGIEIQATFTTAGNPAIVANFSPDGSLAKPRWSICVPPDTSVCKPTGHRVLWRPGRVPAGTVFEATASYRGQTYRARTAPWRGRVHATARPRLKGQPLVGTIVRPVAGRWRGGWGREYDRLRVQACRTAAAQQHCVTLSAEGQGYRGRHRSARIPSRYVGWYVFAYDERLAHDSVFGTPAYGRAEDVPPLKTSATVARSKPLGKVEWAVALPRRGGTP